MPSNALDEEEDKPCRACTDFKSWAKKQVKPTTNKKQAGGSGAAKACPLDREELGRSTWGFLHTMAAYYPERPTKKEAESMKTFFQGFAQFYPCEPCAADLRDDMKANPPQTSSREALSQWLCDRHNTVNVKLGKPKFDCSTLNERWKDGWKDGSCD